MLKDFREFAVKGNMIDMAVGIIVGAAFGKVVTSLVNDIIMPPIGMLLGKVDFKISKVKLPRRSLPYTRGDDHEVLRYVGVALLVHLVLWKWATTVIGGSRHPVKPARGRGRMAREGPGR